MVSVGETAMIVAVADDPEERGQGLMNVEDLGEIEGMLFVFPEEGPGGFWMKDTLLPLDIAFFTNEGELVEVLTMEPCSADPCPLYVPAGAFRFALEVPAGRFAALADDARLTFP
jgi:uncharacterized membrane protein (UPF0127 family)